jgi:hypothetical protein
MGTQPGDCDVISPQSAGSGFRLIPIFGSSNSATGWKLSINESAAESNYYWSVQAIDSAFVGSPFSETSFISPLQLNSPNGGNELLVGSLHVIQWSSLLSVQSILLDFSVDNGLTWVPIIINPYPAAIGSYNWVVPNMVSPSCLIRIKSVLSDAIYDDSNAVFSVLPAPDYSFMPINTNLTGVVSRSTKWGDLDNDNDLDLLIIGTNAVEAITKIYRNNGNSNFSQVVTNLPGVYYGSADLGDYDNDGDLDIVISGSTTQYEQGGITRVYRNDGNMTFTDVNAALMGVYYGTLGWGDCDNDGDLDLFLSGISNSGENISNMYRNDHGSFCDVSANLTRLGGYYGACAWGDYDNDSDLDLLYSGCLPNSIDYCTKLYRNDGGGTFIDTNSILRGIPFGSLAWGDADNDGDLDFVLSGSYGEALGTTLYRNNNGLNFSEINCSFSNVSFGSVDWGDYDNDGDLDLLHTGGSWVSDIWVRKSKIYRNEGNLNFTDINASIPGVSGSDTNWGDYDNDGDLDILLVGHDGSDYVAKIYRNYRSAVNSIPTTPTNLSTATRGDYIEFNWDGSTDAQTPSSGLRYMLRIGTSPGGNQISSPMASAAGFRKLPVIGIASSRCSWKILASELSATFYWSVQAIDTGLLGSAFASDCNSNLPPEAPQGIEISIQSNNATISWQPVTEDMAGNPMQVHTYLVFCSDMLDGEYNLIGQTSALSFSHANALQTYQRHFYKIVAVSDNPTRVFSEEGLPKFLGKPINNVRE